MTIPPRPAAVGPNSRARQLALVALALVAGCQARPPEERSIARIEVGGRDAPSPPIASPDTTGAIWTAAPEGGQRIVYGKPGGAILVSLACTVARGVPHIAYTRHAAADPRAKAILALIGNGHVTRLKIDAARAGGGWNWQGAMPASDPALDVLAGPNRIEATVPGAGSVILNASALPGELLTRCRALAPPAVPASAPAAAGAALPIPPDTTGTAAPPPPPGP